MNMDYKNNVHYQKQQATQIEILMSILYDENKNAILPTYSSLDSDEHVRLGMEFIEKEHPELNFVELDCLKLNVKDVVTKHAGALFPVHCSEVLLDRETLEKIKKDNTILFLNHYCQATERVRRHLMLLVQGKAYNPEDGGESMVNVPLSRLTVIYVDEGVLETFEPFDTFEAHCIGAAE